MSLADPRPARTFGIATLGLGLSLALHLVGWAGLLDAAAPAREPPPQGIEGAFLVSLEVPLEAAAAPAHDAPHGETAPESPAPPDTAAEDATPARVVEAPPLPTTPYRVKDPDLAFAVANPDQEQSSDRQAEQVPTERRETQAPPPVPSRAARPPPRTGQRHDRAASAAQQQGLEQERRRQVSEWQRKLALALDALKTYPDDARADRAEGRAVLRFTIDRAGRLTRRALQESAGHPALDAAALGILERAGRLPPPPPLLKGERFDIAVPVTYRVR
ncbi:MAG: energy transducer TonB [Alphaproteobacteria bacterium]|nr:energy transducer TonB [Alphaproteobacteria bacterium]